MKRIICYTVLLLLLAGAVQAEYLEFRESEDYLRYDGKSWYTGDGRSYEKQSWTFDEGLAQVYAHSDDLGIFNWDDVIEYRASSESNAKFEKIPHMRGDIGEIDDVEDYATFVNWVKTELNKQKTGESYDFSKPSGTIEVKYEGNPLTGTGIEYFKYEDGKWHKFDKTDEEEPWKEQTWSYSDGLAKIYREADDLSDDDEVLYRNNDDDDWKGFDFHGDNNELDSSEDFAIFIDSVGNTLKDQKTLVSPPTYDDLGRRTYTIQKTYADDGELEEDAFTAYIDDPTKASGRRSLRYHVDDEVWKDSEGSEYKLSDDKQTVSLVKQGTGGQQSSALDTARQNAYEKQIADLKAEALELYAENKIEEAEQKEKELAEAQEKYTEIKKEEPTQPIQTTADGSLEQAKLRAYESQIIKLENDAIRLYNEGKFEQAKIAEDKLKEVKKEYESEKQKLQIAVPTKKEDFSVTLPGGASYSIVETDEKSLREDIKKEYERSLIAQGFSSQQRAVLIERYMKQVQITPKGAVGQPVDQSNVKRDEVTGTVIYNGKIVPVDENDYPAFVAASDLIRREYLTNQEKNPSISPDGRSISYTKTSTSEGIKTTETETFTEVNGKLSPVSKVKEEESGEYTLITEYKNNKVVKRTLMHGTNPIDLHGNTKVKFKSTKDGPILTYNGREIEPHENSEAGAEWFKFTDGKPGMLRFIGDIIIEQDETGTTTISKEGSKEKTILDSEQSQRIIGNGDFSADFGRNLPQMLTVAELNRMDRRDLTRVDDTLITDGAEISLDGNQIVVTEGTRAADGEFEHFDAITTYNKDDKGNLHIDQIELLEDDIIVFSMKSTTESGNPAFEIVGENIAGTYVRETKDNIVMYCMNPCFNVEDGKFYDKQSDGSYKECEDCEEQEKNLGKILEKHRVASGGPNNREQTAITTFNILESAQTGIGKLLSLFMSDEDLAEWRQGVDDFFCSTVLFGGTDCWVSEICSGWTDKVGSSTLLIDHPGGVTVPIAHIEGEVQEAIYFNDSQQQADYIYKFSYGVRNPTDSGRTIEFNVILRGDETVQMYDENYIINEGETFSKSGTDPVVQDSTTFYHEICLVFPSGVANHNGDTVTELCNDIVPATPRADDVRRIPGRASSADPASVADDQDEVDF
ncbi:hypothetical protein GOV09_06420 [Candidatus Woesearchaeota archaeon]|nr:hypothetical protein [Candidatus Woesearchaeota archaeon]